MGMGPGNKNDCAGEGQQQFAGPYNKTMATNA
jgi:hypothetical protein